MEEAAAPCLYGIDAATSPNASVPTAAATTTITSTTTAITRTRTLLIHITL